MRIFRKDADDFDARVDLGVGLIDNAERRLAARDQDQSGAHVLGHRQFRFQARPDSELFQCRLGIKTGRYRAYVAGGDASVTGKRREIETGRNLHVADF